MLPDKMPFLGLFGQAPSTLQERYERNGGQELHQQHPPIVGKIFPFQPQAFHQPLTHRHPQRLVELLVEFHAEKRRSILLKGLAVHLPECCLNRGVQLVQFVQ